nr:MAG TPA: tail completion protein [Caudoviricetes sp.]
MKLSDFAAILEQVNLPVTYRAFKTGNAPDLPYLVYYESSPAINTADNTVNHQIKSVTVELAFENKDEDLEERLEELWTTHELFFDVQEETFIKTERLYVKSYTVYLY